MESSEGHIESEEGARADQDAVQSHNEQAQEIAHETTIFAEPVFKIGNFEVTNSLINSWGVVILILIIGVLTRNKIKKIPGKFQSFMEVVMEAILDTVDPITGSREKTKKVLPLVLGLFIFILLNNWLGILPGVGSIGYVAEHDGHAMFIPYFRGGTADLNTTLALSIMAIAITHIWGVIAVGAWNHLNKFINFKALIDIPRKIKKDPTVLMINPIKFAVGLLEIVSEIAKIASLAFRLFGNIFAGEVLLFSMAAILMYVLPIPFLFMELFVGLVQALIFSMLTLVFIVMMTSAEEH